MRHLKRATRLMFKVSSFLHALTRLIEAVIAFL